MSVDERLLYSMHECVGGHALRLHDAEDRFKAAAHTYDPDVVCGQRMKGVLHKLFTVHDPSTDGSYCEASAAFLRCHQEVEVLSRASNPNPNPSHSRWHAPSNPSSSPTPNPNPSHNRCATQP